MKIAPQSPLGSILGDVDKAINAKLYYPALVVALTIPEICSALCEERKVHIKQLQYVTFVNKYATPFGLGLEGLACYRLRGGVIHRGNAAGHAFSEVSHVIFTVPESAVEVHGLSMQSGKNTAGVLSIIPFCAAMTQAAERWYEDYHADKTVIRNFPKLLSWRAEGVYPFIVGTPVIASEI